MAHYVYSHIANIIEHPNSIRDLRIARFPTFWVKFWVPDIGSFVLHTGLFCSKLIRLRELLHWGPLGGQIKKGWTSPHHVILVSTWALY
jgi:hypothetical protein